MADNLQIPTKETVAEALANAEPPCISLYQPTHRFAPDNKQDPIRFKNLIGRIEESLSQKYSEADVKKLLRPFHELEEDRQFWNHTLDGICILASPGKFHVFNIPRTMPELVVVNDTFHRKPLRKFLQSTYQYQLLALSLDEIELYQGSRNKLQRIDVGPEVPTTIDDALGRDVERETTEISGRTMMRGRTVVVAYGHGGGKDERAIDQERFFRAIDKAVSEHISHESKLPLILVALAEHHSEFHKISQNQYLVSEGIRINPKAVRESELQELAWKIMEPKYHERLDSQKDDYRLAHAKNLGSDDINEVAKAAAEGRVATLFLEEDKIVRGHLDPKTGDIKDSDPANAHSEDLYDDLGELVESNGGKVLLIPAKHMPSETGLAAIYRY